MDALYFVEHRWAIHGPALASACLSILGSLFVIVCAFVSGRGGEPAVHGVVGLSVAQLGFSVCIVIAISSAEVAYDVCGYFGFVDLAAQTAVRMWVCVIAVDVAVSVIRRASKSRRTLRQRERALSGHALSVEERATGRSVSCSRAPLAARHAIVLTATALVVCTLFAMSWLGGGGPLLGALETQHSPCFDAAPLPLPNACNRTQWVPKKWCAPALLAFGQFAQRVLSSPDSHEGQVCVDTLADRAYAAHSAVDRFVVYDRAAGEIHAGCWLTSGFDRIVFISLPALLCCFVALGAWCAVSCTLSSTARRVWRRLVRGRCLCAKRWPGTRASGTSRVELGERATSDALRMSEMSISINAQLLRAPATPRRLLGDPQSVGKLAGSVRARYNRFTARYILVSVASLVPMLVRDVWTTVPEQFGGGSTPHTLRRSAIDPRVHFYSCGRDTHSDASLVLLVLDSVFRPLGGAIVALVFALSGDLTPWTLECGHGYPEPPYPASGGAAFVARPGAADPPPRRSRWRCCCRIVRRGGAAKLWLAESRGHYTVAFRRSVHSLNEVNTQRSGASTAAGAADAAPADSQPTLRTLRTLATDVTDAGSAMCSGGEVVAKLTAKEWRLRQNAIVSQRSERVMQRMPGALMAVLPRLTERLAWKICSSLFRVLSSGEMHRILVALDAAQRDAYREAEARCGVFAREQERTQRDAEDGVTRTLASSSTLDTDALLLHALPMPLPVALPDTSRAATDGADVERVAFMLLRSKDVVACLWDAVVEACEVIGLDVAQFYDVERSVALE